MKEKEEMNKTIELERKKMKENKNERSEKWIGKGRKIKKRREWRKSKEREWRKNK